MVPREAMKLRTRQWVTFTAVCLFVAGCGGGGGGQQTANVNVGIRWGERSRTVEAPSSALSAVFTLKSAAPDGTDFAFTVERNDNPAAYEGAYSSPRQAKLGQWDMTTQFFSQHNGAGSVVGTSAATITLKSDGSGIGDFATTGRVATVEVTAGQLVGLGKSVVLAAHGVDAQGATILVTPGAIFWQVSSGADVLQIQSSGTDRGSALGLKLGTAKVVATIDGVSSLPTDVTVGYDPTLQVTPSAVTVYPNGEVLFGATVTSAPIGAVVWKVQEGASGGTISNYGEYIAPATPGTYHVVVVSRADTTKTATATITVLATAPLQNGLFVLDGGQARVVRMDDITGAGFCALGTSGSGVRQFNSPNDMAIDGLGRIYVSDRGNNRIVRFDDMTGKNWVAYGTQGSEQGQFTNPNGLCVTGDGRIYVADADNHRIVRIDDMTGSGWTTYSRSGTPALVFPRKIAVRSDGRIYIASDGGGVQIDNMSGAGYQSFSSGSSIALMPNNRILQTGSEAIWLEDDVTPTNVQTLGGHGSGYLQFNSPQGANAGADSRIYVADTYNYRIIQIDDILGTNWKTFGPRTDGERLMPLRVLAH